MRNSDKSEELEKKRQRKPMFPRKVLHLCHKQNFYQPINPYSMKNKLLCFFILMLAAALPATAQQFVNLTPRPAKMTVGTGSLTLPQQFAVNVAGLSDDLKAEAQGFVTAFNAATGYAATLQTTGTDGLIKVSLDESLADEAYTLSVTAEGVSITAAKPAGLYFAFQTIKKILPANVMAGVADATVTAYTLPVVSITDAPRFSYRGFMLDVSRHFFTVDEVKKMLDVMSYYKLNKFHWHITDDQGWRVEIKKYPKLTSVGSIAPNSRFTDMYEKTQYWINKPYGPYYYTQEQLRDVVEYARQRHIDIIPEVDMPGHFVAALCAYPEFSCKPDESRSVWSDGGISYDVLNVANPAAVQLTKDVLDELMDIFPYETLHIGGDECPTNYWESNADCQALYASLGLTNYRQLQSHFIKELADHVKAKGRKLAVWNEGITADGADLDIMKETGATVYCWTGPEAAATKAATLGLPRIYTPWGPYYINRRQGDPSTDPPGAGPGNEDVKKTYEQTIPTNIDFGVQGTFWTEHVSDADYMQWLALPRLIAVAERGWTPQSRASWTDFQQRVTADTLLLNLGGYKYCKYKMVGEDGGSTSDIVLPKVSTDTEKYYYRLISGGTDSDRKDRCIELLSSTSSLVTTYKSNGAAANRLWTNTQADTADANYDYQWWSIEADPSGSGKYALVCKAIPEGSVNPTPTATGVAGRWTYDTVKKNYNFSLGTGGTGTVGTNYYYTIASDKTSGYYFNSSMPRQGLAVNVYNTPGDGNGGYWQFAPMADYGGGAKTDSIGFDHLTEGSYYTFRNAVEGYGETYIVDDGTGTALRHAAEGNDEVAWQVKTSTVNADGSQTVTLANAATGRAIAAIGSYETRLGYTTTLGTTAAEATITYVPEYDDFRLKVDGKSLFPLPSGKVYAGATVSGASYDTPRRQGAEWSIEKVDIATFNCVDQTGNSLGTIKRALAAGTTEPTAAQCPAIANHTLVSVSATGENTYTATYRRSAYSVYYKGVDAHGVIVCDEEVTVPVGESYTIAAPVVPYFTLTSADPAEGTAQTLTADVTVNAVYTTDALIGAKEPLVAITTTDALKDGGHYLLYDATTASGRAGYRLVRQSDKQVNRATTTADLQPNAVWTLEGSGSSFKVKNEYTGLYVPQLVRSTATTAAATGVAFTFTPNSDGETWNVKGSNGQYWDGLENGALVGWNGGTGHPIAIYAFTARPMYSVSIVCKDTEGTQLSTTEKLYDAGDAYTLIAPIITNYTLKTATEPEGFDGTIGSSLTFELTYEKLVDGISTVTTDNAATGIYDLSGRRVARITRAGLYIINGKKVLVK